MKENAFLESEMTSTYAKKENFFATKIISLFDGGVAPDILPVVPLAFLPDFPISSQIYPAGVGTHKVEETAHKVVGKAHKVVGKAHKVVETAHKVVGEAHKVEETAHKVVGEAHKVVGSAHKHT